MVFTIGQTASRLMFLVRRLSDVVVRLCGCVSTLHRMLAGSILSDFTIFSDTTVSPWWWSANTAAIQRLPPVVHCLGMSKGDAKDHQLFRDSIERGLTGDLGDAWCWAYDAIEDQ